ncbi:hypothetical protein GVX76_11125 [[Haemophilus] felis]|nr:hypothetical protein [[Haemophilus] felis]
MKFAVFFLIFFHSFSYFDVILNKIRFEQMTITEHMKELQNIVKKNIDSYKNIYIQNDFTLVKNNLTTLQRKIIYYSFSLLKNEDRELDPGELCRKEIIIELPKFLNLMNLNDKGGEVYNAIKR